MNYTNTTTACVNAPSRKLFRPMFRARWQNMQNIVNDSAFIEMIPEPYLTYYQAFIFQWLQWSRGFVPMLHQQDFFSTGMGYTVCDIFARECMSGGFRIVSQNDDLKTFLDEWGKDEFTNIFSKMFFNANAGGNAVLVTTPIDGDLFLSVLPIDRIIFQIGRNGDISRAVILNRFVAGEEAYFAKEHRIMCEGKPYYKVELGRSTTVTSPTWQTSYAKDIPPKIADQWQYAYGDITPNTWYAMPERMRSLGLYNVRNKAVAVAIADLPGYSDSTLHTALDVLYSIDYNYTQAQVDQYFGKSRALIPPQMQTSSINTGGKNIAQGQSFTEAIQDVPLSDDFYTQVKTNNVNGGEIKPTFMQPDLRGEAHKFIRDAELELLASKVGLSSSDLANHLTYNSAKTATEVRAEQDTTETNVNIKRALANRAINRMLCDVAQFYGFTDSAQIEWGRAGVNTSTENQELLADYQAGTISLKDYLKKRWTDLTDDQAELKALELEAKAEKEKEAFAGDDQYPLG